MRAAFPILGSFAMGSLVLWVLAAPVLRPACAQPEGDSDPAGRSPVPA